jgi:hypothetical protein
MAAAMSERPSWPSNQPGGPTLTITPKIRHCQIRDLPRQLSAR